MLFTQINLERDMTTEIKAGNIRNKCAIICNEMAFMGTLEYHNIGGTKIVVMRGELAFF
jgi:hypothetical protein